MDRFIETVRRYPCLWNTAAIEYRDQELKDAAWAEVMKETDLSSVKEVKLKWKKLRDSYRDALKRQSEPAGARRGGGGGGGGFPWKYSAHMQFLQPHMAPRRRPAPPAPRPSSDSSSGSEPPPPAKRRPAPAPDPLDEFFSSMCQSTKRFPIQTQIKIKRSLFEAVMEAEEALLPRRRGRWPASSSASSEPDAKPC